MGTGYAFKCKKCGHEYDVLVGCGFRFPKEYQECIKAIKCGKYGSEWKSLFLETHNAVVDADEYLYICRSCGNWKVEKSLSLYSSTAELSEDTYVMPYELNETCNFIKSYFHKCKKCKKRMHRVDEDDILSLLLPCPKCGTENNVAELIMWD